MDHDALVIGSGFGGAVSACRLAQAGLKVAVLERGRRWAARDFPLSPARMEDWLWSSCQGLYDVRTLGGMVAVMGAGYGGGSLVYANVHLRPPAEVFGRHWPAAYNRHTLDPYFDLVAHMLDIQAISASARVPPKTRHMAQLATSLGRQADFFYPPLAVRFDKGQGPNKFGVVQGSCIHCGECDAGCPTGAKNTLDHNYLALAEQRGATVRTGCEVLKIAPITGGYEVTCKEGGSPVRYRAASVFLCAGAVGSTELLLRCRDQYATLGKLSARLGERFSGNGDLLTVGVDAREKIEPANGPTITTALRYQGEVDGKKVWFLLQEGGYPHLRVTLESALAEARRFGRRREVDGRIAELMTRVLGQERSLVLLGMGQDRSEGRLELLAANNELRLKWDADADAPLYETEERLSVDVVQALGGRAVESPLWKYFRKPITVHALGGCPMGPTPALGVLDDNGEVHNYPNLFVLDGAALPGATGVNPSSTIAAFAERNVERFIQRALGQPGWRAPERAQAVVFADPLTALGAAPSPPPRAPAVGVQFTETMIGHWLPGLIPPSSEYRHVFEYGERMGRQLHRPLEFTLQITMPHFAEPLDDSMHAGVARGRVRVDGLTGPEGAAVDGGVFQLFVPAPESGQAGPGERRMFYFLPFVGGDGKPYLLDGAKLIRNDGWFDVWGTTTTLYTRIREGHTRTGAVVGAGIVRIAPQDFARQLTTMRVVGTRGLGDRLRGVAAFTRLFFGSLWEVFTGSGAPRRVAAAVAAAPRAEADASAAPSPRRPAASAGRQPARAAGESTTL